VAAPAFGAEGTDGRAPLTKAREGQERRARAEDTASGTGGGADEACAEARRPGSWAAAFVYEGAAALDTWPPPTCKVGSGRGRDKGGRV
jgi:hypothetical protein